MRNAMILIVSAVLLHGCTTPEAEPTAAVTVAAAPAPQVVSEPAAPAKKKITPLGVVFDKTTHDFGEVHEGDVVSCTFTLTNATDVPLRNLKSRESCGCTTSRLSTVDIDPGEQAELAVELRTLGYSGFIERRVTIYSPKSKSRSVVYVRVDIIPRPQTAGEEP